MTEENKLQKFEQKYMMAFIALRDIEVQKKELEEQDKQIRAKLAAGMEEFGIESIDNKYVKIIYIGPTSTTTLDTKKLKAERPELFNSLMKDFSKTTSKKGYTRITTK